MDICDGVTSTEVWSYLINISITIFRKQSRMKTMNTTASVILSMVIVLLVGEAQSQNYHFSNGWQPGKRSQDMCQFRSDVKNVIFKLIEVSVQELLG